MRVPTEAEDLARLEEIAEHLAVGKQMIEERRGIFKRRTRAKPPTPKTALAKASRCTIDNVNQAIDFVPAKKKRLAATRARARARTGARG